MDIYNSIVDSFGIQINFVHEFINTPSGSIRKIVHVMFVTLGTRSGHSYFVRLQVCRQAS